MGRTGLAPVAHGITNLRFDFMSWLISSIVALLTGLVGLFLSGVIGNACAQWYHVSSREGQSGFYVIFIALAGGVVSTLLGLLTARLIVAKFGSSFIRELGVALLVVLLLAGVWALLARLLADVPPEIDGRDLVLEVEFRFPAGEGDAPPTAAGEWEGTLTSISGGAYRNREYGEVLGEQARLEGGRWIVPVRFPLFTERGGRAVAFGPKGAPETMGFLLPIPARPGSELLEWSVWLPRQQPNGEPWPESKPSCRFRLQKTLPTPPPPTAEELEAEKNAQAVAEFEAIPADAPIETWFAYTAYEQFVTPRAVEAISRRPRYVEELNALVVDDNPEKAHAAMICISRLPNPSPDLVFGLQAAARLIAKKITQFNLTPKEDDPNFATAVDPATRMYGWIAAANHLREKCGADLVPELKVILELSRVRPESQCMRGDIGRLASHYLHEWAGVPPLPTDPAWN